ncbi:MAG: hypothetical protein ACRYG8_21655 [Janthinobacterium lividum]
MGGTSRAAHHITLDSLTDKYSYLLMDLDLHNPTLQADRAALEELRDLGMEMARYCINRAKADAEDGNDVDRTPAFERVSRGVRRAVFLLQHIATLCAKAEADLARTQRDGVRARQQIIRDVEDATVSRPKPERDALVAELYERLDAPEFDRDLAGMTVAQASELIRRDFGLGQIFTHQRRTPADVETLAARARHSAHAAALPDHPEAALVAVLRHEADLRRQT